MDQDFGAESDDDVNFNPAPADESDNEGDADADLADDAHESEEEERGRTRRRTPEEDRQDVKDTVTQPNGLKSEPHRRERAASGEDIKETIEDSGDVLVQADGEVDELDENKFLDDEDDEEEAEEDDDEEVLGHRHKKRRKDRGVQGLFDVEAEVDEEEDEIDEEEDELKEGDGFIADTHPDDLADLPAGGDTDDRRHRELDRRREVEAGLDAERQAEEYRKRYGRNRAAATDSIVIPKRLLLPSVEDPSIWGVKCKPGKEREIVLNITKRVEERAFSRSPLVITSAFERGGTMAGYIYVEAPKQSDVYVALDGLSNVYPRTKLFLVPIKEMPDLLRTTKSKEIEPGSYVRIKRGKYQGDLAQVDTVVQSGLEVGLRIVPRLDYGLNEDVNAPMAQPVQPVRTIPVPNGVAPKRKRVTTNKAKTLANRPPQRLFSEVDAKKKHAKYLHSMGPAKTWSYLGDTYKDGFLMKDFKINLLQLENVNPNLEEVTKFVSGAEDGTENLDLNALAADLKASTANAVYLPGDVVEIYEGEQQGVGGSVVSVQGDIVTMTVNEGELRGRIIEVPVKGLRKRFREGDHVKVVGGSRFRDEAGMVVKVSEDRVTILSDVNMNEITVFNKDLRKATDSGKIGALGKFDIYDLVQLDPATVGAIVKVDRVSLGVLDQNGTTRTVLPSQISNRLDRRRHAVATDRNGSEIRTEDTVREVGGESKQGVIVHIHRSFLFLRNYEQSENAGMFVARAANVATVAAKGGRLTNNESSGPDLTKMNPAVQRNGAMNGSMLPPAIPKTAGRDRVIGKTVTIRKGPYKGLLGIVKDTTDFEARVELHTNSKTITVPKDCLGIRDPRTGHTTSYQDFAGGRGRGMGRGDYGGATPARRQEDWQGSRTPIAAAGLEARTPAWGSARTPAWTGNATIQGGRTPAWKQDSMGGRTPAYGADGGRTSYGGRTPAWSGAGNATPFGQSGFSDSYNAGSKTPAYGAGASSYGGFDNGSKTPAYGGNDLYSGSGANNEPLGRRAYDTSAHASETTAPTPGAINAPTPGAYAAPTPAASAPTPHVPAASYSDWGGESAPTPAAQSAPTPGVSSSVQPPSGYYDGAPTPAGYGNAETPGGWGGAGENEDDQPRYSTPSP
ncbi:MAG: transcription elongation factor spt5 [Peltula sp. TS41687]|nr:MAG: transcription elongation factor spt5 [Peltula sp. TS41687]